MKEYRRYLELLGTRIDGKDLVQYSKEASLEGIRNRMKNDPTWKEDFQDLLLNSSSI